MSAPVSTIAWENFFMGAITQFIQARPFRWKRSQLWARMDAMKPMTLLLIFSIWFSLTGSAAPVQVTTADFGDARQPQLALNRQGDLFLVFGNARGIWFSSSTNGGKTFSASTKIDELKGLALGMRRGPRIAATENRLTVTAISHENGNLSSWHSADSGVTWSKPAVVNDVPSSAREGMHGLAGDEKGNLYAVWLDLRDKKTQLWGSRSVDGGKRWGENVQVYQSPDETICECCHPSVVFNPKGEVIAMWRNWLGGNRDMYRSISTDGGRTFGMATKLGTGEWPLKGCPMDGGSLAVMGDETAYVWRREQKLFVTTPTVPEILISESGSHPIVVPGRLGFQFIWQAQGNLYRKNLAQSEPTLLARGGAYAAAAWSPNSGASFIAWEGTEGPVTTVFVAPTE